MQPDLIKNAKRPIISRSSPSREFIRRNREGMRSTPRSERVVRFYLVPDTCIFLRTVICADEDVPGRRVHSGQREICVNRVARSAQTRCTGSVTFRGIQCTIGVLFRGASPTNVTQEHPASRARARKFAMALTPGETSSKARTLRHFRVNDALACPSSDCDPPRSHKGSRDIARGRFPKEFRD